MRQAMTGLVAGWLALAAAAAAAQELPADPAAEPAVPRYAVEIILFRYGSGVATGNELFLPEPPPAPPPVGGDDDAPVAEYGDPAAAAPDDPDGDQPDTAGVAQDPAGPAAMELEEIILPANVVGLQVIPPGELTLEATWNKLQTLDAYEPVLWAGWTQDVVERDRSPTIALRRIGNAPAEYDGTLQLYLSRFLHLVVDLTLTPRESRPAAAGRVYGDARNSSLPFDPYGLPGAGPVRLRIEEDRIVKNGDLRYFDHPRFGLRAKVTRVEQAEEVPADGNAPAAR